MTLTTTLKPAPQPRLGFVLLLAALSLAPAAKAILADTLDPDCFWHLRVGAEIARAGWPRPLVDDLSFASIRTPWTPYSWLAEVAMARLWDVGGYRMAVAVQALLEAAFLVLLALAGAQAARAFRGRGGQLAGAVGAAAAAAISLPYLSFRPVTMTLVGLAAIAWLLLRDRQMQQRSHLLWLVPPITAVLINIHFFALLSPLWAALLLTGDVLESRLGITPRRLARGAALTAVTAAACLLTPLLPGTLRSIAEYASTDVMVQHGRIAELAPFYHGTLGQITAAAIAILLAISTWRWVGNIRRQQSYSVGLGELLWLTSGTAMALLMGRMLPVYAIIAAPFLAAALPGISDAVLSRRPVIAALAVVAVALAVPIIGGFPKSNQPLSAWLNRHGSDCPNFPCAAADFVQDHIPPRSGHLICEFNWGGYLEWRHAGRFQVLMDGRTQLFSPQFWTAAVLASPEDRRNLLASTAADAAILSPTSGYIPLLRDLGWHEIFRDPYAIVMQPHP